MEIQKTIPLAHRPRKEKARILQAFRQAIAGTHVSRNDYCVEVDPGSGIVYGSGTGIVTADRTSGPGLVARRSRSKRFWQIRPSSVALPPSSASSQGLSAVSQTRSWVLPSHHSIVSLDIQGYVNLPVCGNGCGPIQGFWKCHPPTNGGQRSGVCVVPRQGVAGGLPGRLRPDPDMHLRGRYVTRIGHAERNGDYLTVLHGLEPGRGTSHARKLYF